VSRGTIIVRRDESDAYGFAVRDLASREDWKREKAEDSPWIKWALEMAEKTAISHALRRGLVPLADRMSAVLAADVRRPSTEAVEVVTVPRGAPAPRMISEALGLPPENGEPSDEEKARILAEEQGQQAK
jgi:recombinational DNA repair protein RecT